MLIIENPIEPNLRNTRDFEMTIFAHSVHRHSFVKKTGQSDPCSKHDYSKTDPIRPIFYYIIMQI